MTQKWQIASPISQEFRRQFPEIPETVLQLLHNRGLTSPKQIDEFLNPEYARDVRDPFLFRDMKKATERIFQAVNNNELIVIHGDYDADGVCASVILFSTLKNCGAKRVDIFLPDRELEGYGLNKETVELVASAGAKLIISCDCGISNKPEVERAKELGLDVIITDHHAVPEELPPACAIIHPRVPDETYPDKNLSGGGVAFKLAQALLTLTNKSNQFEKWLLDLVAISSVADMVPLLGESRALVKYGLIVLNKTKRLGLRKLIAIAGLNKNKNNQSRRFPAAAPPLLNAHHIAFQIAPRINAAGRVQHANTALQLLLIEDETENLELARDLNARNQERQKLTDKMTAEAKEIIVREKQEKAPVIFVLKKDWPVGLIGLIASRLSDEYWRPVMALTEKDGRIHGSGRSIDEINIMEKLEKLKNYFEKFGGHPQACGFTLKNSSGDALENFKKQMIELTRAEIKDRELTPTLTVDAEINLEQTDWPLIDWLKKFEPFGEANPEPKFLVRNVEITDVETVGSAGQHLKLLVKENGGKIRKFIGFSLAATNEKTKDDVRWPQILKPGDKMDAVIEMMEKEWNGRKELELKIIDLKKVV